MYIHTHNITYIKQIISRQMIKLTLIHEVPHVPIRKSLTALLTRALDL